MPAPPPQPPAEILALGAVPPWPDPLPELIAQRLIRVEAAAGLYQAAAMLRDQGRYLALLVDPESLSRRELEKIVTVKRHVALPIWSLPTRHRKTWIGDLGILPWEEACRALSSDALGRLTPQATGYDTQKYAGAFSHPPPTSPPPPPPVSPMPKAHNPAENAVDKRAEIPVESQLADRYDKNSATPLLSEAELRALLGRAD
jgi:hypothetical protein